VYNTYISVCVYVYGENHKKNAILIKQTIQIRRW